MSKNYAFSCYYCHRKFLVKIGEECFYMYSCKDTILNHDNCDDVAVYCRSPECFRTEHHEGKTTVRKYLSCAYKTLYSRRDVRSIYERIIYLENR